MPAMSLALRVAAEVRAESARRRVTGRELARRTGVPISTLSRWTTGQTPIQLDDLDRIAAALGADVVTLIAAAKQQRPDPDGAGPQVLPQLDSNQQPAGYTARDHSGLACAA